MLIRGSDGRPFKSVIWGRETPGAGKTATLEMDLGERVHVAYYINSQDDAVHSLEVSADGTSWYSMKTITMDATGIQIASGVEVVPWQYVRLRTATVGDHHYELSAKG